MRMTANTRGGRRRTSVCMLPPKSLLWRRSGCAAQCIAVPPARRPRQLYHTAESLAFSVDAVAIRARLFAEPRRVDCVLQRFARRIAERICLRFHAELRKTRFDLGCALDRVG